MAGRLAFAKSIPAFKASTRFGESVGKAENSDIQARKESAGDGAFAEIEEFEGLAGVAIALSHSGVFGLWLALENSPGSPIGDKSHCAACGKPKMETRTTPPRAIQRV